MELDSILNSAFIKPMFNKLKKTMIEKKIPAFLVELKIDEKEELKISILETGATAIQMDELSKLADMIDFLKEENLALRAQLLEAGFPPPDMPEEQILNPVKPAENE